MNKHLILMLLLLPGIALADPSISTNSGRKNDTSSTTGKKMDKSLSADKSNGNRETWSDSNEKAREESQTKSHSTKTGNSLENSSANSVDINITGLLLKIFRERYETDKNPNETLVQQMLGECKAVSGLLTEYPTLNECPSFSGRAYDLRTRLSIDLENVVPYRLALRTREDACGMYVHYKKEEGKNQKDGQVKLFNVNPNNQVISRYARCRMFASKWIRMAGDVVPTYAQISTTVEVTEKINHAFSQMDMDEQLFENIKAEVRESWKSANCSPWLTQWHNITEPNVNCGVFVVKGHDVWVENQKTLSEDSIEGHAYKITLNASASDSLSEDNSLTDDERDSASHRDSDSREKFREAKKTATLSKSNSLDKNRSNSKSSGSGADISATPAK